jgi:hypothetical protein
MTKSGGLGADGKVALKSGDGDRPTRHCELRWPAKSGKEMLHSRKGSASWPRRPPCQVSNNTPPFTFILPHLTAIMASSHTSALLSLDGIEKSFPHRRFHSSLPFISNPPPPQCCPLPSIISISKAQPQIPKTTQSRLRYFYKKSPSHSNRLATSRQRARNTWKLCSSSIYSARAAKRLLSPPTPPAFSLHSAESNNHRRLHLR